jgi:hypothetical protein
MRMALNVALIIRVISLLLISFPLALAHRQRADLPCRKGHVPGWATFTDRAHGFCFQYPSSDRRDKPAQLPHLRKGSKLLANLTNGAPLGFCKNGERPAASISVVFSTEALIPIA